MIILPSNKYLVSLKTKSHEKTCCNSFFLSISLFVLQYFCHYHPPPLLSRSCFPPQTFLSYHRPDHNWSSHSILSLLFRGGFFLSLYSLILDVVQVFCSESFRSNSHTTHPQGSLHPNFQLHPDWNIKIKVK